MSQWDNPTFDLDGSGTFVPLEWDPTPVPAGRPSRRRRLITVSAAVVLILISATLGGLAYHESRSAQHWQDVARTRAAEVATVDAELAQAHTTIAKVQVEQASLDQQVSSLTSQLSDSSAQNTTLQQELSNASNTAQSLQQCIDATNKFNSDANSFGGLFDFGSLQKESKNATETCRAAESANQNPSSAQNNG